jgi:hypothetical protein
MKSHGVYYFLVLLLSLSTFGMFIHSVEWFRVHSFSLLSSIPLHQYAKMHIPVIDTWVDFSLELLWIELAWTFMYKTMWTSAFLFLGYIIRGESLEDIAGIYLTFKETINSLSKYIQHLIYFLALLKYKWQIKLYIFKEYYVMVFSK